jgi:hypothetical protein
MKRHDVRIDIGSLDRSQLLVGRALVVELRGPIIGEVSLDRSSCAGGLPLEVIIVGGSEGVGSDDLCTEQIDT